MKKRDLPQGDDGRVVADMNVEGMPWYREPKPESPPTESRLTKSESRLWAWESIKAGMLFVLIVCAALAGITLFITKVWLG